MHYPYLVLTTCVSAGMIAMGVVLSDWSSDSAPLQPCQHVPDGLPYTRIMMCVSCRLACGSYAAAPAVLAIRRVAYCSLFWSRRCWMCSCRSASRSGMYAIPARRRLCCTRFVPAPQRPRSAPAGDGEYASTQAGSPRHGERLHPGLTQRDIWVMHRLPPRGRSEEVVMGVIPIWELEACASGAHGVGTSA